MSKIAFPKPGNFIYPVPAVMVSCADREGNSNIITIAWTGTVCSDPPMAYISVRKERASYDLIKDSMEFVINLPSSKMAKALDYCGCVSMRKANKWQDMNLTKGKSTKISSPTIEEAPISIECKVTQIIPLGTHDMFLAEVVAVQVDDEYMDENGSFHMEDVDLVAYSHGRYYGLAESLGSFGYSVRKKKISGEKPKVAKGDKLKVAKGDKLKTAKGDKSKGRAKNKKRKRS